MDQAIANAAKARNPGAVFAFRALKHKMEAALGLPGGGRLARLSDRKIEELMRLEIRERRESNEFAPPTSEEYQRNREVIAVLTSRLGRTGLDARRR